MSGIASSVSWTTATNAESYDDNAVYYGGSIYWGDPHPYGKPVHRPRPAYPQQEPLLIRRVVEVPAPDPQNDRKENDMIQRQTFLDALTDEGKVITVEERETIRCADDFKFSLLIARLLARAFESTDLAMLKERPKEVLVTTKEA